MIKQKIVKVEKIADFLQSSHINKEDIISIVAYPQTICAQYVTHVVETYCLILYYESKSLQEG